MNKKSTKSNLPWWVELLFVQVGLPDNWLRSFLKTRKRTIYHLKSNKEYVFTTVLLLLTLAYINPLIKQASTKNNCIKNSERIVKLYSSSDSKLIEQELDVLGTHFCNGGTLR